MIAGAADPGAATCRGAAPAGGGVQAQGTGRSLPSALAAPQASASAATAAAIVARPTLLTRLVIAHLRADLRPVWWLADGAPMDGRCALDGNRRGAESERIPVNPHADWWLRIIRKTGTIIATERGSAQR